MKTCFKCLKKKHLTAYYKHAKMKDGHLNKCKECTKLDNIENRNNKIEYYQKYDRERANLPKRIAIRNQITKRWATDPLLKKIKNKRQTEWREKNKEKRAAHVLTGNAIRDGRLIRQPCEVCGKKKVEAHHDDYLKPLDVRWLCRKHHMEHHKQEREKARSCNTSKT